jgi:hypothetical protein
MTINRRQAVKPTKAQTSVPRAADPEFTVDSKSEMSKLRIGFIESDTSPRDIRQLLEDIGTVGEISIHSDQNSTYALADMTYEDAVDAVKFMDKTMWRGCRISVEFANRAYSKDWLSGHEWKPPKRNRW